MSELHYGIVEIIKGKYKGEVGYYDDDEGARASKAIVYLGSPCLSDYILVKHDYLKQLDMRYNKAKQFIKEYMSDESDESDENA